MPFKTLYSPANGDLYTNEDGQWYRICHYTWTWHVVDGPPVDGRSTSVDARCECGQRAIDRSV